MSSLLGFEVDAVAPEVVRSCPGRVRVHLRGWTGQRSAEVEATLEALPGVHRARSSPVTRNLLVEYDEARVELGDLLAAAARAQTPRAADAPHQTDPPRAARDLLASGRVVRDGGGVRSRARIAVSGLERDAELAARLVGRLRARPGVSRVSPSRLTGRVLVEFDEHRVDLEDLLAQVAGMELPDLPGEDCPTHPLDPGPLIDQAARTAGAALGLGLLAVRRLAGAQGPPSTSGAPVAVAAAFGILDGLPPLRRGLRRALGQDRAQLALAGVHMVSLTFAGSPLGLAVTGAGALRLLTEIRVRRAAWIRYEERLVDATEALPGEVARLEAGERCPLAAVVIEGSGTMIGRDGRPQAVGPGDHIPGGARVHGGPFVVELRADRSFEAQERPAPPRPTTLDRYLGLLSPVSLGYAALIAALTRSPTRALSALLLVNARPALIGAEAADAAASARVLRSGVTVVTAGRRVRRPDVVVIDGARVLVDRRLEVSQVESLGAGPDESEILSLAAGIATAAGSPWGPAFPRSGGAAASDGAFEGDAAFARVDGRRMRLGPVELTDGLPNATRLRASGYDALVLSREADGRPLGLVTLRPRLATGALRLLGDCRRRGIAVEVLAEPGSAAPHVLGEKAAVRLVEADATARVREHQRAGRLVAVLSDSPHSAAAFAAADLAIALTSGLNGRFAARADLLAPDLDAVGAIIQAGARREAAVADAVSLSVLSNVVGGVLGLRSTVGLARGSEPTYIAALAAIGLASARLAGGRASGAITRRLADPEPERWGAPALADVFRQLDTAPAGLKAQEAARRMVSRPVPRRQNPLLTAAADQLHSPLNGALAAGAAISLMFGAVADVGLIAAVIVANAGIGVWQERQAGRAAELLSREAVGSVTVRRPDGPVEVSATELVPGDVVVLGSGDRVPADARLIESESLEVDEASLTGESLPVTKDAADPRAAGRVILEGSDITVGTATAVVFAVGAQTRMGATEAALAMVEPARGGLDRRLNRLVRQSVPVILGGAGVMMVAGLAWRRPLAAQLAVAASIATAVVPEGLPLLAGVSQAAVARRLAARNALVRRLSVVEALGRVDVACTDKTGTLTAGRLRLTAVEAMQAGPGAERGVLLAAALASPHPQAPDVGSHPTDLAVIAAAEEAGLGLEIRTERSAEAPFDPARSFHATVAGGRVSVKGAAEALVERCRAAAPDQAALLARAERMAERGLRVLMVAEGTVDQSPEDPRDLLPLGLIGISDPLRDGVPAAVARCHEAGVRVIMLTGDHPATARAVAEDAGLRVSAGSVLTGSELAGLDEAELDRRLREASVVARITPIDKVRIVERLQSFGHTVAMTGDGVNDAPALRLADVGVAMGLHGTEVARQASDVVLSDDDFATMVETLVEGRSFWRNLRRSLGLLLGGNLGELGLMVGASVLGLAAPLATRQILAVNLITDVLPALAVAAQQPEHRDLATLRREGGRDMDTVLRADIVRRGWATAAPALGAYALATRLGAPAQARSVAFGAIVATQLGQTLSLGRAEGSLTRPVLAAIAASGGFAVAAMVLPRLSGFLGLAAPSIPGIALIAAAAIASVALASPRREAPRAFLPWTAAMPSPRLAT